MGGLLVFGVELEEYLINQNEAAWLIFIVFYIGVLSTATVALMRHANKAYLSLVGASNGVFCLLGASLVLQPFKVIHFIPIPIPNAFLIICFIGLFIIKSYKNKANIDVIGHLVGFIIGTSLGFLIKIAGVPAI
jgi:membrane associated rhomboid family serine protease